jgi:hypothetical protein
MKPKCVYTTRLYKGSVGPYLPSCLNLSSPVKPQGMVNSVKHRFHGLNRKSAPCEWYRLEVHLATLTISTLDASTPSAFADLIRESTFSCVFARYPTIFVAFAAFCAGVDGARTGASDGGGYTAAQNCRKNSFAAV